MQPFGAILFISVLGILLYGWVAGIDKLVVTRMRMERFANKQGLVDLH